METRHTNSENRNGDCPGEHLPAQVRCKPLCTPEKEGLVHETAFT